MPRTDSPRALRNRARIAQAAARLIAEHGLNDWQAAKRKACRHLGLPDHEALPGNEEVEQALRDYNTLFQGTAQTASLRAQRVDALGWMERLSQWKPLLTGAVAAGWAIEHSEVRLELEADLRLALHYLEQAGLNSQSDPVLLHGGIRLLLLRKPITIPGVQLRSLWFEPDRCLIVLGRFIPTTVLLQ